MTTANTLLKLRRGDSTDFNDNLIVFTISNPDGIDLDNWKGRFQLDDYQYTWTDITGLDLQLVIPKEETTGFTTGLKKGSFKLFDQYNRAYTVIDNISFYVYDLTVPNTNYPTIEHSTTGTITQTIEIPVAASTTSNITVSLVTNGSVISVNGKKGIVVLNIEDIPNLQTTLTGLQTQIDDIEAGEGDFLTKEEADASYATISSVSLLTDQVTQNTANISTNTSNISTNTSNIEAVQTSLNNLKINSVELRGNKTSEELGLVGLISEITQLIKSNIAIQNGKKLLLEKNDGTQANGLSMADYTNPDGTTYEQLEVGTTTDPTCLNHNSVSPTDGVVVGKNIIVNYKDGDGSQIADAVAYLTDVQSVADTVKITYLSSERNAVIPNAGQDYFTVPADSGYVNVPVEAITEFNNRGNIPASSIGQVDTTLNILKFTDNATDYFDMITPVANLVLLEGTWAGAWARVIIAPPTATVEQMTALSSFEGGDGSFESSGCILLASASFTSTTESRALNLSPIPIWAEINNGTTVTSRNGYYLALQIRASGADVRLSTSTDLEFNAVGYNKNKL